MSGETRLNPAVQNIRSGGETVINPALGIAAELPAGTLIAVKGEVLAALEGVDCPYIAPMYYSGSYSGRHFEVLPYYRRGSLRGRQFGIDELKSRIIPEINEALGALHDAGIIHKDLKPSNIMLTDSGDIAIIDFGISSVQSDGNSH